ncbi:MAG: cytochrome c3 family protein [Sedimentisphaerales bacterium]|nr:cytochrome c3 family protein [Sedimentisphaerales bacterium]
MFDREPSGVEVVYLSLILPALAFLAAGCERTHAVTAPSQSAAEAPLLLEDEPEDDMPAESGAENSRCFVCHMNYAQEQIAVAHAKAGIGCANCHGPSDAHIADESWASGDNGTAPDIMYPRDRINPSCMGCHAPEKIGAAVHQAVLAAAPGTSACTDCHGDHRLPQRRCKWK